MRVIGGSARGRRLDAPPGTGTRPITDRAKEAIFNMLASLGVLHDEAAVLDLYAGSGSFGIESLSRGVARATFVEMDRTAAGVLQSNLDKLGFASQATVVVGPVETALARLGAPGAGSSSSSSSSLGAAVDAADDAGADVGQPFDVAFCDPPYALDPWAELLERTPAGLLVGHAEHDIELPDTWRELRRKSYGRARVVVAERVVGPLP